jgi:hypothetical protein
LLILFQNLILRATPFPSKLARFCKNDASARREPKRLQPTLARADHDRNRRPE